MTDKKMPMKKQMPDMKKKMKGKKRVIPHSALSDLVMMAKKK